MALNKVLNATYDLNGYLYCWMPDNAMEVEVKIKTTWGKYTLIQDENSRTEKYCSWDRADRRSKIHTKRRRATRKEVESESNNSSETDILMGEGYGYPPQVFTYPELATNIPQTEEDRVDFIGEYCDKCIGKHDMCWCNSSDWDEDLIDIENPTNNTNLNLESEKPSQTSFRECPPGWSESRRKAISKTKHH